MAEPQAFTYTITGETGRKLSLSSKIAPKKVTKILDEEEYEEEEHGIQFFLAYGNHHLIREMRLGYVPDFEVLDPEPQWCSLHGKLLCAPSQLTDILLTGMSRTDVVEAFTACENHKFLVSYFASNLGAHIEGRRTHPTFTCTEPKPDDGIIHPVEHIVFPPFTEEDDDSDDTDHSDGSDSGDTDNGDGGDDDSGGSYSGYSDCMDDNHPSTSG